MDLFDENNLNKLDKDERILKDFAVRGMSIQVLSSSDPSTSYESLLQIKYLFQKMLPKMPKDYILRQVFDEHHCCLTLNHPVEGHPNTYRVVGAVCYRPCFERDLVEIVFLAVDSDFHVSGYGAFLFSCFKEVCKLQCTCFSKVGGEYMGRNMVITSLAVFDSPDLFDPETGGLGSPLNNPGGPRDRPHGTGEVPSSACTWSAMYLLTYADNSAVGFFKKQGFSFHPRSTGWMGYIKDYEGGTLMECKIHREINYLARKDMIRKARNVVFSKMKEINEFHVLHQGSDRKDLVSLLQEYQAKKDNVSRTKEEFLADFLHFLICTLQAHPSSWPFLEPVSAKDVPDYFDVISHPMDMSLMMRKIRSGAYTTLEAFSSDVYLMCSNCFSYNGPDTQYYKCAESIKKAYEETLGRYKDIICRWGCV